MCEIVCSVIIWVASTMPNWSTFFESNVFGVILGGALTIGATIYGQRLSERSIAKKALIDQIHACITAISVAYTTSNTAITLKSQHVKALHDTFTKEKARLAAAQQQFAKGIMPAGGQITFVMDFRTLDNPPFAIDGLKRQLFERMSPSAKTLIIFSLLEGVLHSLAQQIDKRNAIIAAFQTGQLPANLETYFGFPDAQGHKNEMYSDLVRGLYDQNHNVIIFGEALCKALVEHADQLIAELKSVHGKNSVKALWPVPRPDFSNPRQQGLMPVPADYAQWAWLFDKK